MSDVDLAIEEPVIHRSFVKLKIVLMVENGVFFFCGGESWKIKDMGSQRVGHD